MQTISIILFLVLASTNASNYFHPLPRYQQDPREKLISVDSFYPQDGYNDDYFGLFLPKLTSDSNTEDEWISGTNFRTRVLQQLLNNRLTKPDESRSKRTEASLSIVNALDVLRQRLILELARRRLNESKAQIEKNRVLLIKTGKRSLRNYKDALGEILLQRQFQNEQLLGKSLPKTSTKDNQDIATARKNSDTDSVFQT